MATFGERFYDKETDRLFLAYYALPQDVVNANQWGVSSQTIAQNIRSFVGRPVVLKRKDPNNPKDAMQAGEYVHPYAPQHSASLKDQIEHQSVFTVGKILDVKLNPQKGYKFELEISDPLVKEALKANNDKEAPQWVSPLIAETAPNHDEKALLHWAGLHIAFVDRPAYGFELMKPAVICSGSIEECTVPLRNASELNQCGFCPKDAMLSLLYSSLSLQNESTNSLLMSANSNSPDNQGKPNQNPNQVPQNFTTNTTNPVPPTITASEQAPKMEGDPNDTSKSTKRESEAPEPSTKAKDPDTPLNASIPKTLEEAIETIKQRDAYIEKLQKQQQDFDANLASLNKFVSDLKKKERIATLRTMIPKDLFKTASGKFNEEKYNEELEKAYNYHGISDETIAELYQSRLLQQVPQLKAASAKYDSMKDVPDFHGASSQKETSSDNRIIKSYELMRLLTGGGRS